MRAPPSFLGRRPIINYLLFSRRGAPRGAGGPPDPLKIKKNSWKTLGKSKKTLEEFLHTVGRSAPTRSITSAMSAARPGRTDAGSARRAYRVDRNHETTIVLALLGVMLGSGAGWQAWRHTVVSSFLPGWCQFSSEVEFLPSACEIISDHKADVWQSYIAPVGRVAWLLLSSSNRSLGSRRAATSRCPNPTVGGGTNGRAYLGSGCECVGCRTAWPIGLIKHEEGYRGTRLHSQPLVTGCQCSESCVPAARAMLATGGVAAQRNAGGAKERWVRPGSTVPCYYDGGDVDADVWFVQPRPRMWLLLAAALLLPSVTVLITLFCRESVEEAVLALVAEMRGWARLRESDER